MKLQKTADGSIDCLSELTQAARPPWLRGCRLRGRVGCEWTTEFFTLVALFSCWQTIRAALLRSDWLPDSSLRPFENERSAVAVALDTLAGEAGRAGRAAAGANARA